ncbi:MAG: thermonuclease family protein [Gemmatimonadetes bacterium]|nr:thermonuclease family protein [Gemmatimonadota bacterium]
MTGQPFGITVLLAAGIAAGSAMVLDAQPVRAAVGTARDATCEVLKLSDGDSFRCRDGREVRMLLMDTPELAQAPWGRMAAKQLEQLIPRGTTVRLEFDRARTDRYRRTLAYVWADSVLVNEWMVARGWAVVLAYENVRYLERMQRAERAAQAAKRGLWQAWGFRCRPVDFRARRCGR